MCDTQVPTTTMDEVLNKTIVAHKWLKDAYDKIDRLGNTGEKEALRQTIDRINDLNNSWKKERSRWQ